MDIMVLDIILLVLMLVFAFLGYKKGFMRSILSMLKGVMSLIIAVITAKPIAAFFDRLFGLGKSIGSLFIPTVETLQKNGTDWFTTIANTAANAEQINTIEGTDFISTILQMIVRNIIGGAGDNIIGSTPAAYASGILGFFALIVITAIIVFVIVRILLRVLDNLIQKMTEKNTGFSFDAWLGAVFGIVRFFVVAMSWMVLLFVLSSIPFLNDITKWLFSGSMICSWLYELTGQLVLWFFQTFDIVSFVVSALGLG